MNQILPPKLHSDAKYPSALPASVCDTQGGKTEHFILLKNLIIVLI